MDEVKIESKLTTGVVSKLVSMAVSKKLGCHVDIQLNAVRATVIDGETHIHLDVDAELSNDELNKLLKSIGL